MTDDNRVQTVSRRSVLRQGTVAIGAASLGVAGFSGTAVASDCPRTPGFWANHDWCDVPAGNGYSVGECLFGDTLPNPDSLKPCVLGSQYEGDICANESKEFLPGIGAQSMSYWQDFLLEPARGDKGQIMGKHIVATRLNGWRRPGTDGDCYDEEIDLSAYGLESTTVRQIQLRASEWLAASSWPNNPQRSWYAGEIDGEPLKDVLDAFNNGHLDLTDCNCIGDD